MKRKQSLLVLSQKKSYFMKKRIFRYFSICISIRLNYPRVSIYQSPCVYNFIGRASLVFLSKRTTNAHAAEFVSRFRVIPHTTFYRRSREFPVTRKNA